MFEMTKELKIKVCGMKQAANIAEVAQLQPDYLGFIFYPKSPRYISEVSSELIKYVPNEIKTVGVFVDEDIETVKAAIRQHQLKAVQLHGKESPEDCMQLKNMGVEVIKAFGISVNFNFETLVPYLPVVDYFLFDTQTPAHGGSGKVFDWRLLENYKLDKPYFLSGGIDLANTAEVAALNDPRLYAVDVNSKFETAPGLKDAGKLQLFFSALKHKI
jgi:phosphoribosylanthranilate isomerase